MNSSVLSPYKEAILGYIAGFIIRRIMTKISCPVCLRALFHEGNASDHSFDSNFSAGLSLIQSKDRGGLIVPSQSVMTIVFIAEKAFNASLVTGEIARVSKKSLVHVVNVALHEKNLFPTLQEHDFDHEILTEDLHSSQLCKKIIEKYLDIRMSTYSRHFNRDILHRNKIGLRQQSTKLVLFKGI